MVPDSGETGERGDGEQSYLFEGEEVLVDARPAWSAWAGHLLAAGLAVLLSLVVAALEGEVAALAVGVLFALSVVGYVWYRRSRVRYLVTDHRILVLTGISSEATNETWMVDVRGMQTGASLLERLLGHGHITVSDSVLPRGAMLPGVSGLRGLTLKGISNYKEVARAIRRRQGQAKTERY